MIPIRYDSATGAVSFAGQNGSYQGMPRQRTFRIRWMGGSGASPTDFDAPADKTVEYTGAPVVIKR